MEIIISGRHFTVGSEIKQYVEEKLNDVLNIQTLKISSTRVILDHQKARYRAEIIVNMKHFDIEASEETYNIYEAIDNTVEKISRQIRKRLDKLQDHHKRPQASELIAEEEFEGEEVEFEA